MLSLFLELIRHIFAAVGMVGTKNNFPKALTREEEAALVARLSSGDTAARDELIERNLRLVAHIAKKYSGRGRDNDDLISIGSIGLVKAIGTFNTEKGGSVAAYAARCIENAIRSQMRLWSKTSILRAAKSPNGIFLFKFQRINACSAPLWEDMLGMRPCISIVLG